MTLLMGVKHVEEYLDGVCKRLDYEELKGKRVMVEAFSYPIDELVRDRWSSFANFWDGICKYVVNKGGEIIFGENKKLYYGALEKMRARDEEIDRLREPLDDKLNSIKQLYPYKREKAMKAWIEENEQVKKRVSELSDKCDNVDPLIERDPHFAKVVVEESPDIVVLGWNHMPYLVENCFDDGNYSLTYVPSDVLVGLLKHGNREDF